MAKGSIEANRNRYASDIELVALMKSQGIVPMTLRAQDPEEAQKLEILIDDLNELHLMPAVDARVKDLQNPPKTPPSQHKQPIQAAADTQSNFFHIVTDVPVYPYESSTTQGERLEKTIDRWHKIFQGRGEQYTRARAKMLAPDASREWRQFLASIGYTQEARNERLRQKTEVALMRLDAAGVLEKLFTYLDSDEQRKMLAVLQEYDRDHQMTWRKWVSTYASS